MKVIRVWNGCKVVGLIEVSDDSFSSIGTVGGAGNSTRVDIEIDPWRSLIVDHGVIGPPVNYREAIEE